VSLLAPWFYRSLLEENNILECPEFFTVEILNNEKYHEAFCALKKNLKPDWVSASTIYSSKDGSGTSKFKNIAVYKAISEALERWAFYEFADSIKAKEFCFDQNPTTTGMAAYPSLFTTKARANAILEAGERWALHEFWRGNLPVLEHTTNIKNLHHYEIVTEIAKLKISLLSYKSDSQYLYAFAADRTLASSIEHALIELARNTRVMKKFAKENISFHNFSEISDKRLAYFASPEGHDLFNSKILNAPKSPLTNPKLICDTELKGPWNQYTKVWRYLYANSYPDSEEDHTTFMF
jgi:hypothetical protein